MSRPAEWCRRIWHLLNRRRFEEVLRCEMDAHRAALDRPTSFGNTLRLREQARDVWGWNWFDDAVRDVRLAARTLRRAPGFAITSVLLLGLGIGVNLALLQVVVAVLVRPQPLRDPATLVRFDRRGPHFTSSQVSYPLARYVGAHNTVLSAVLARSPAQVVWDDGLERIQGAFVSASWFGEFGARAELGRVLGDVDTAPGAPPAVVVSHAFWRRHLDGRPDVVGSPITVNSEPATLVGVVGADFPDVDFGQTSIWMPLRQIAHFVPGSRVDTDWTDDIDMYARLRPGVSREAARDGLAAVLASLRQAEPAHVEAGEWLDPYLGTERFSSPRDAQQAWTAATAVMVLVVLVLLVACLNLSNLAFARAMSRLREMSIRVGLGAGRWRVMRHVLSESALVSICGGVAGVLLSMGALRLLAHFGTPVSHLDLSFDWRMGLATLAAVALALAAVGLVPAWKIGGADLALATRDGGERLSMGLHESRLRLSLVAGQIAGTCLLLVFTAQLARSVQRALSSDLGYDFSRVVVFDPDLNAHGIRGAAVRNYWQRVRDVVAPQPETASTALASYAPLSGFSSTSRYRSAIRLRVTVMEVESSFFSVMGIRMLSGRTFNASDDPQAAVIISRNLALEMYGTLDVIGRRFPKGDEQRTIVGVSADASGLVTRATDVAEQYAPLARDAAMATLLVRARTDPARLVAPLREAARAADSGVLPDVRLMRDDFEHDLRSPMLASALAGGLALLGLVLACLGIFGVVSYGSRLRTKEIGIRLALGAQRATIARMLLRTYLWAGALGVALGLLAAGALSRALAGAPFYLRALDPVAYAIGALVLVVAGAVAALAPTLRTVRADPLLALRQE